MTQPRSAPLETRERILDAAGRVFARKGYKAVSLDEVARDAGMTKGAIYWHFRSKDDLFFALLDHRFQLNMAPVPDDLRMLASATDPRAATRQLLCAVFARIRAEPDWPMLYLEFISQARDASMRERLTKFHLDGLAQIATHVRSMQASGVAPATSDPDTVALFWSSLFDGLLLASIINPQSDVDAQLARIVDLLWDGMSPGTTTATQDADPTTASGAPRA